MHHETVQLIYRLQLSCFLLKHDVKDLVCLLSVISFQLIFPLAELLAQRPYLRFTRIELLEFEKLIHSIQNPLVIGFATYFGVLDFKAKFQKLLVIILLLDLALQIFLNYCKGCNTFFDEVVVDDSSLLANCFGLRFWLLILKLLLSSENSRQLV